MLDRLRRQQVSQDRLLLRSNGVLATLAFGGLVAVFTIAALPKIVHSFADALIFILLLIASWRFLQTAVVVDHDGIAYHSFHRTLRFPWQSIEAFAVGPSGITVGLEGGRAVWLMPTKPVSFRRQRNAAEAEDVLRLIVERNAEPMEETATGFDA